ncbi:helix-turn-helix domain-containing protein [Levilactobacillus parabrevis]|uniref:XRE family transcriptional regulator n=1 Tax=Levilactobacillus parabrevis ATCC 53295 TaxID=1267003 RepID=A0A0R1H129_9LACO|nr:helix-turn-helix domain-containing protein [Levilactobacillus parabrevis]KRK39721.1 XRE family transcriptional regulator [Levilactobacillus parabrevis ATCC 53295]KRO07023.1 XRE family transcriptional regulator [Levilactobacillus parabrevis]
MSENKITLGKTLRDARIAKGFTLDDLQQTTKIQKRYLIAIEDQNFDELPGDFYVRAFIKQYADMVDLDGAELLKQFDSALPSTQTQEYVDKVNENNPETRSQQRKVDDRYVKLRRTIPVIGIVIVVLVVLVGIWVAASHNGSNTKKDNVDSSSVSVSGSSNKSSSSSSKSSSTSSKSSSKKAKTPSFKQLSTTTSGSTWEMKNASSKPKVALSASSSAWVAVSVGGATTWQGTLSSATSHTMNIPSSATSVTFKFGNAPATKVKVDGKTFDFTSATATSSATSSSTSDTTTTTTRSSTSATTTSQVQTVTLEFK